MAMMPMTMANIPATMTRELSATGKLKLFTLGK